MAEDILADLAKNLEEELAPHKFRPHSRKRMDDYGVVGFWQRCTPNLNRAVALVRAPDREFEIGPYCQWLKWRLLWQSRFFVPFFYEVGLQIVLCGPGLAAKFDTPKPLQSYVDSITNQFVCLQSLFVVDSDSKLLACARTWGQILTGPFQDTIARVLREAGFEGRESE